MSLFSLGAIDPLLVETFAGFDRGETAVATLLLGDGVSSEDEVLQQGSHALGRAQLTGVLAEAADVNTLRGYAYTKNEVTFTDSNGNATGVRVLDLAIEDFGEWWTFSCTLRADAATSFALEGS